MKRLATYALFTSLAFAACSKKDTAGEPTAAPMTEKAAGFKAGEESADGKQIVDQYRPVDDHRKVIRTGHIDLVVTTYDDARAKLDAMLAAVGGYVDSTQVNHSSGQVSSATLVLRIPHEAFGAIVPKLRELGEIASESTAAEDITDQYVDIEARLASAKTLEKRLLELAADKTSGVEALLAVERELARVRGEIESYEGRMRQWNDQIAMSTLTLSMSTKAPAIAAAPQASLGSRISHGFHDSIGALQSFGESLAVGGGSLLPWMILIIPAFLLVRRSYRRLGKSLPAATAVHQPPAA